MRAPRCPRARVLNKTGDGDLVQPGTFKIKTVYMTPQQAYEVVVVGTGQAGGLSFEKIPEASHQDRARRGTGSAAANRHRLSLGPSIFQRRMTWP